MNAIEKLKSTLPSQRQKIECTNCGSSNINLSQTFGISTNWDCPWDPHMFHNGDDTFKVKCNDCGVWIKAFRRTNTVISSDSEDTRDTR